jgi:membrane-bound serine protease (ClpP class)
VSSLLTIAGFVILAALLLAATALFLTTRAVRARRPKASTGAEGMVGEVGEVVVPLEPEGKVFVHGEYWNARAPSRQPLGARIRVVKVMGERLEVEGLPH